MSTTLFPILTPEAPAEDAGLPLCREVAWDYGHNRPVFRNGEPVVAEGAEAVLVWAWLALHTPRFRYEIYTWAYGSELESLIGQPYTEALKLAEGKRYIREALETNPYIRSVGDVGVSLSGDALEVSCTLDTIYGRKELVARV